MNQNSIYIQEELRIPMDIDCLEKFRKWAMSEEFPKKGISYFGGDIDVDMSPAELNNNKVTIEFAAALKLLLEEDSELFVETVLLTNIAAELSTCPDLFFISHETIESDLVQFVQSVSNPDQLVEVMGSPDMTLEVVSRSSVKKDTVTLRSRYFQAGVKEYWIADIRGPEIEFRILRRGESDWLVPESAGGWQHSDVFRREFQLSRTKGRSGQWRYRVESRS